MVWLFKTKAGRFLLVLAAVAAIGCLAYWCFLQPKIRTASFEEVKAVVPGDLLQTPQRDGAEQQYRSFLSSIKDFDSKAAGKSTDPNTAISQRLAEDERLLTDDRIAALNRYLVTDYWLVPINRTPHGIMELTGIEDSYLEYSKLKSLERVLCASASDYRETGDRSKALRNLLLAVQLDKKFWRLGGPIIQYLVSAAIESTVMKSVAEYAADPDTSPADCTTLLKALEPAPARDYVLKNCWIIEFQSQVLPVLPDPYKGFVSGPLTIDTDLAERDDPLNLPYKTSYDALETAKYVSKAFQLDAANALQPYSQIDLESDRIREAAGKGLPEPRFTTESEDNTKTYERYKFRLATYRTHNYYGRAMISHSLDPKTIREVSCRWRAKRNAVRILLASRIYRSNHGGRLPRDLTALQPIAGFWPELPPERSLAGYSNKAIESLAARYPTDPFDGKPMRYNREKEIVYSVGKNLRDDGGAITGKPDEMKDVGISLKLVRPTGIRPTSGGSVKTPTASSAIPGLPPAKD